MAAPRFEFRILGPLEVWKDGVAVNVGGPRQRLLLGLLLLGANRVVSRDRLLEELGDGRRSDADRMLRVQASRLRKALATDGDEPRVVARPPGYLFRVEPGEVDFAVFERLRVDAGRALADGDPERAVDLLGEALALWRGAPLADLELGSLSRVEVERMEEVRLAALEERIETELGLGHHSVLIGEVEALVAEHPLRERLRAQLMLALYRSGRQAEALEVYRRGRARLHEELGLEPAPLLQELEREILRHDPALGALALPTGRKLRRQDREHAVCPFKGLAPYEAADSGLFFGREGLVTELVAGLVEAPAISILGASGSGKSSLVRAGLLPALTSGVLPGSDTWRQLVIRPGEHPCSALRRALGSDLAQAVESCSPDERLVLAVDQFEEVFTMCRDTGERREFVDSLVEGSWDADRRAVIIVAMRVDFLGRLAEYSALAELLSSRQVLLSPMGEAELRRAIIGPAERTGLAVEPGLVDSLIRDVAGEPGALPLLSSALLELWQSRQQETLELAGYERMGRVEGAVSRLAENAYARLREEERAAARRIMLALVAGGDGEALVRRRVPIADFDLENDPAAAGAIATLTDKRVLTAGDGAIELVHEALLAHWGRLRDWLDEDAEGRRLHRRLAAAAAGWDEAGRDADELYRGARLAATLDWAAQNDSLLDRREREFLEASQAASVRAAENQRRENRRLRGLLAIAVAALAIAIAAGVVAFEQRSQAKREATAAEAQRLGAQALIQPDLDLSLLLAREGVNLDDTPATRGALLAALLRAPAALAVVHSSDQRVLSEALRPDGRRLAFMTADGGVDVVDTTTFRSVRRLFVSSQISLCGAVVGPLHALAYGPNGALAIGSTDGNFAQLALLGQTGETAQQDSLNTALTADLVFSHDGRTLATGEVVTCSDHPPLEEVILRDATTGKPRLTSAPIRGGRLIGYTAGDRELLVAANSSSVLLDTHTLKPMQKLPIGGAAALSPDGEQAAFGDNEGRVTLVQLPGGKERALPGLAGGPIDAVAFSTDGSLITTAAENGDVALWSTANGIQQSYSGHAAPAQAAIFSPDGRTIYSSSEDGRVIAWDASGTRRLGRPFRFAAANAAQSSAVSPDRTTFAVSPGPNRVALWHTADLAPPRRDLRGPVGDVSALRFSPDGTLLAASGSNGTVLWDVTNGRIVRTIHGGPSALAFSPRSDRLVMGAENGTVVSVDLRTGAESTGVSGSASVSDVDISSDGKLIASAALDGTVTLWQTAHVSAVAELTGAVADYSVAFSPNGQLVAAGDSSGTVVLWDVKTKKSVGKPLTGHNGGVVSVAFDPSGHTLLTASTDGQLRLWDVATRKLIGAPLPGSSTGGNAVFFPDGKHVLGTFSTGTGIIWDVDPTDWNTYACRIANRNLTRAEWTDFLPDRPYRRGCP